MSEASEEAAAAGSGGGVVRTLFVESSCALTGRERGGGGSALSVEKLATEFSDALCEACVSFAIVKDSNSSPWESSRQLTLSPSSPSCAAQRRAQHCDALFTRMPTCVGEEDGILLSHSAKRSLKHIFRSRRGFKIVCTEVAESSHQGCSREGWCAYPKP